MMNPICIHQLLCDRDRDVGQISANLVYVQCEMWFASSLMDMCKSTIYIKPAVDEGCLRVDHVLKFFFQGQQFWFKVIRIKPISNTTGVLEMYP